MRAWQPAMLGALLLTAPHPGPSFAAASPPPAELATPAPMPDLDAVRPRGPDDGPPRASVTPGLSRPYFGPTADSQGYTEGSSYSNAFDARFRLLPTLRLSVPLQ